MIPALDQMIELNYLIANEDRHFNNFGGFRNAETLEWMGMSPIFDSGNSLGYGKTASQIRSGRDVACKPFKKTHAEKLKLVSSLAGIDFVALAGGMDLIYQTMSSAQARESVGEERIDTIAETV